MAGMQTAWTRRSSPVVVAAVCALGLAAIGVIDYLLGYERTIFVAYFLPIGLAAAAGGIALGVFVSALSISIWIFSDIFAGAAAIRFWDAATGFMACVGFHLGGNPAALDVAFRYQVDQMDQLFRRVLVPLTF